MFKLVIALTTFLSAVVSTCWANPLPLRVPQAPTSIPAGTSSTLSTKEAWLDRMQNTLPNLLCQKDRYFVECFTVTAKDCEDFTKVVVSACLKNVAPSLPAQLDHSQGEYWGQRIGRCSYDLYNTFMTPKKRNIAACKATPESTTQPAKTKS